MGKRIANLALKLRKEMDWSKVPGTFYIWRDTLVGSSGRSKMVLDTRDKTCYTRRQ